MELRAATSEDRTDIRRVADRSLDATYSATLGRDIVAKAADEWYADDRLRERLADDAVRYFVATVEDEVVAFAETVLEGDATGTIEWLHVHPEYRDRGYGRRLLEYTEAELLEAGANRIEGRVLLANEAGNAFYQSHGYARTGERSIDVGGESYTEHVYLKLPEGEAATLTEERDTDDGTVFVAFDERERGSKGPLYAAYRGADRTDRYGFYCGHCGSTETTMDSMGRIECNDCGNERRANRWDAAYL